MDSHHSSHLSAADVFKELKELKKQQWQMKITMNRMEKGTYKCSSTELLLKNNLIVIMVARQLYCFISEYSDNTEQLRQKIAQLERGIAIASLLIKKMA